jgi:hypothetical protein
MFSNHLAFSSIKYCDMLGYWRRRSDCYNIFISPILHFPSFYVDFKWSLLKRNTEVLLTILMRLLYLCRRRHNWFQNSKNIEVDVCHLKEISTLFLPVLQYHSIYHRFRRDCFGAWIWVTIEWSQKLSEIWQSSMLICVLFIVTIRFLSDFP